MNYELHLGDCLEVLRGLPANSIDSVVTDPPYGIRFMGKSWDGQDIEDRAAYRASMPSHAGACGPNGGHRSVAAEAGKYDLTPDGMRAFQAFTLEWATEALRVLKPGGHLLSFAAARTYHHMAVGIEMAGFEIRDQIMWVFGSGFPKSHNLKGDRAGWGTALKPAHEPICMARKPFTGTVAANVEQHGTGAINIDACRIDPTGESRQRTGEASQDKRYAESGGTNFAARPGVRGGDPLGRWPANLIHDGSDVVRAAFPSAKGQQGDLKSHGACRQSPNGIFGGMRPALDHAARVESDESAARFFYCAKTTRADRHEGLIDPGPQFKQGTTLRKVETTDTKGNNHPTVKPTDLMAYLLRLVTPTGGKTLDPFMGSGSTGKAAVLEGFDFIGIEQDAAYMAIAKARIGHAHANSQAQQKERHLQEQQLNLFSA
ncbi:MULTISPECIES: DNA-methyltransferase [Pseudomonas syringae group]|uniref:Methyltransferase n=2 Tax=Pseudomonas syringae group TaxID=136849 RepID=A0AAW4DS34_PSESX|nr:MULTISPECIES: site-specific DNA-methyltransferase [Pseudomonas syringae group]AVI85645.1 site-specific DNA-methyltransferase [Pseudomonas syringae pv. tomato]KGK96198.1 DNA methyltransferase [Pseudomonas syringae pv. tomato]KUR47685.1 Modification methylase HindIII [Pseudomonas syringae pv. tomato]KUR48090.1 Modification methylase HindIII [Pseudomonas syringae pv. tomato]MBI6711677.1 site-specific DNA-methyltransferase [Pseudomonas syringae]